MFFRILKFLHSFVTAHHQFRPRIHSRGVVAVQRHVQLSIVLRDISGKTASDGVDGFGFD